MHLELMKIFENYWEKFLIQLPRVILALAILMIAFFVARRLKSLVVKKAQARLEDPLLAKFLSQISKWAIVILSLALAFHIVGLSRIAGSILAGAGVSAVIFGFAFKDIGENFLAGIILAFKRPFKIGDTVQTGDILGKIETLDIRYTHIKSFDGKDIYVPNSMILKTPLINSTKNGLLRFDFGVRISYDEDAEKARKLIIDNIIKNEGVLEDPGPTVIIEEITKRTVNLRVFYWVNIFDYKGSALELKTNILNQVKKALLESGFSLPSDILELKIHKEEHPIPIKVFNIPKKLS